MSSEPRLDWTYPATVLGAVLAGTILSAPSLAAEKAAPRDGASLVGNTRVSLRNDESAPVSFYLNRCGDRGKQWSLAAEASDEFPCRDTCDICVPTTRETAVSYALRERARYRIFWDDAARRWDVAEIAEGKPR